jgi:hypothetical protein
LVLPNGYANYKLEGRKAIFGGGGYTCDNGYLRWLIMKEGNNNGIIEMFSLFHFFYLFNIYYY